MDEDTIDRFLQRTTLRQIEVMITLLESGSMQKTADALDMSVANVSRTSKRFEQNLGISIFVEAKRRSSISPEGCSLIEILYPLSSQIAAFKQSLRAK